MLKYVSRHVRDSLERTCNVLHRKSFTCTKKEEIEENKVIITKPKQFHYIFETPEFKKRTGEEEFKKKYQGSRYQGSYCSTWLNALTWSSALIAGWYASQLLCLHRRNQRINFDQKTCYSRFLQTNHRALTSNAKDNNYQDSRVPPPPTPKKPASSCWFQSKGLRNRKPAKSFEEYTEQYNNIFKGNEAFFNNEYRKHQEAQNNVYNVNNTNSNINNNEESVKETKQQDLELIPEAPVLSSNPPTQGFNEELPTEQKSQEDLVDFAYNNLLNVVSEIEFQMGVQSLRSGDYLTAISHLKMGASHNHPGATFNLAVCYEEGLGVKKDLMIARQLYELSASFGHKQAMYNLGVFFARGLGGLTKDYKEAKKYFKLAADLGQVDAQIALGLRKMISEQNDHILKQDFNSEYNSKAQFFSENQLRQVATS